MVSIETLEAFIEAFNKHDLDEILSFFADDCVMDLPRDSYPWGRRTVGKDQVRDGCISRFKGLPDAHYGDDHHWVVGNMGISEWKLTGTSPSGERIEVCGTDHLEFNEEGKITRRNSFWKIVEK
jgi:ketosteroid isomerase-like protein